MVTNQYSTGTTIIALKYDKGIMIGSDSQTSSGSMIINRSASKITKISNNGVLCRSGSASDTQFLGNLLRMLNYEYFLEKNKDMRIRSIVQIARNICYKKKTNFKLRFYLLRLGFGAWRADLFNCSGRGYSAT